MMLSWTGKSDGHRWAQSAHRYSRRHWRNSSEIPWVTFPVVKILCSDLFLSSVCLSDSQQSERSLEASEPEAKDRLYHLGRSARCTDKRALVKRTKNQTQWLQRTELSVASLQARAADRCHPPWSQPCQCCLARFLQLPPRALLFAFY